MSVAPNSKSKPRLGRGLSSLISVSDLPVEAEISNVPPAPAMSAEAIISSPSTNAGEIAIDLIDPNPHQPRKQFDEAGILSLAASIKSSGLVQPIVVRKGRP